MDGACSSSLLATATAVERLVHGDTDLALAGGVDISLDPFELVGFAKTGALSPGDMNVYDRRGMGFIPGEGCGFLVLKREVDARRDGNRIYALLHGWGISSDGKGAGITAPTVHGQVHAIQRAFERTPFPPSKLDFIEGHGTATVVGDRTELAAVQQVLESDPKTLPRSCGMTSLKSIIGHTKAASGIGGLIKTVIAVNRRVLPPTAGCTDPHPIFRETAHALYPVLNGVRRNPDEVLKAGVSSMGFGGINCHVTLTSADPPSPKLAPAVEERSLMVSHQNTELFVFTGDSSRTLAERLKRLAAVAADLSFAELTDFAAHTAVETNVREPLRVAVVAGSPEDLAERLDRLSQWLHRKGENPVSSPDFAYAGRPTEKPRIGMLFPGQGSQQVNMARMLSERHDWARTLLADAEAVVGFIDGKPLREWMFRNLEQATQEDGPEQWNAQLAQTRIAQPAVCLASAIWLAYLDKLGIRPVAVGGHSLGEVTAFYAAGALDFDGLMRFAAIRGRAMSNSTDREGAMAALRCDHETAGTLIGAPSDDVVVANLNSPRQTVISGLREAVERVVRTAAGKGVAGKLLNVSSAFHSPLMAAAAREIAQGNHLPGTLAQLNCKLFSAVDGHEFKAGDPAADYLRAQLTAPVRFTELAAALADKVDVLLEIGPGNVLSRLISDNIAKSGPVCLPVASRAEADHDLNTVLGVLFVRGMDINWQTLYDRRMVRPFVAPEDRKFIVNYCETPLPDADSACYASAPLPAGGEWLADQIGIPPSDLDAYLQRRGRFLGRVIRADLEMPSARGATRQAIAPSRSPQSSPPVRNTPMRKVRGNGDLKNHLFELVHQATGFAPDTLDTRLRLLDDLNLDSIKAGDLLVKLASAAGVRWPDDPAVLANASLAEILAAVERLQAGPGSSLPSGAAPPEADVPGQVEKVLAEATGFAGETLTPELRLVDDLNLDSIKIADILVRAAAGCGVSIDPQSVADRLHSVADLVTVLKLAGEQQNSLPAPDPLEHIHETAAHSWVRNFSLRRVRQDPAGDPSDALGANARVLILHTAQTETLAGLLAERIAQSDGQPSCKTYSGLDREAVDPRSAYTHCVALMSKKTFELDDLGRRLDDIVTQRAMAATLTGSHLKTVCFVQFGGSHFGRTPATANLAGAGCTALAASLHHEHPELRVRVVDLSVNLPDTAAADAVLAEMRTEHAFSAAGYDEQANRWVLRPALSRPADYDSRPLAWFPDDVILVSGGAKGITAECALAAAGATGARLALLGSTPLPKNREGRNNSGRDIAQTLERMASAGIQAAYYACDLTDAAAVAAVVARIRSEQGPVKALIHGAGLNRPRPLKTVSPGQALEEINPKVGGLLNLWAALKDRPPELVVGLSSIIGITGMPGNAWYGFANEALDIVLQAINANHPETRAQSVAFSIWGQTGMGARMGSVTRLERMGIDAIPTNEGTARFARMFTNDPKEPVVVVTARLAGLDTWSPLGEAAGASGRYTGEPVAGTPGVEAVFRTHLDLRRDPYLKDHAYQGSFLFPTVFGLEAMAQAACSAAGIEGWHHLRLENISLQRPITVDAELGTDIVIRAQVREPVRSDDPLIVDAGIRKSGTGVSEDYFSATLVFDPVTGEKDAEDTVAPFPMPQPGGIQPTLIDPPDDLYRDTLLFQGTLFQRIEQVVFLGGNSRNSGRAGLLARCRPSRDAVEMVFNGKDADIRLPDPFFSDALLQSAALLVPQDPCLPVAIDRLEMRSQIRDLDTPCRVIVDLLERRENTFYARVRAWDPDGNLLARLDGYQLRVLKHVDSYPKVTDLVAPRTRDYTLLADRLHKACRQFRLEPPETALAYLPGIHGLPKDLRHKREKPLFEELMAVAEQRWPGAGGPVTWDPDGKPVVAESGAGDQPVHLSLSHDNRLCLATAAPFAQGCDLAAVRGRSMRQWIDLLGPVHSIHLDALMENGDSPDQAGTRLWSVIEAARKALGDMHLRLRAQERRDDVVLFKAEAESRSLVVLSFPLHLTWGPPRFIALTVHQAARAEKAHPPTTFPPEFQGLCGQPAYEVLPDGPRGELIFVQRFPVTFKPGAQLSRNVYFTNYFDWMGHAREASTYPIMRELIDLLGTGKWGSVTNYSRLEVYGEARTGDLVELRMWTSKNDGPRNGTMTLQYDFVHLKPDGRRHRLAFSELQTTWVELVGHGLAKPAPYPPALQTFFNDMIPKGEAPQPRTDLPAPLADWHNAGNDEPVYAAANGPVVHPQLAAQTFETSQGHGNAVGNVYYAKYYEWQGLLRDNYLQRLIPDYFGGVGERGEGICLDCRVDHLREAMPFDTILVTMALKQLHPTRALLHFDYFRADAQQAPVKLAWGNHTLVWVVRDELGRPQPAPFPEAVMYAFKTAIARNGATPEVPAETQPLRHLSAG